MLKILDRYILREQIPPFLIGIALFTLVLLMQLLLDLARMAIRGNVALLDVTRILGYAMPHILALSIPMSVLLAVNLGLGRMSADNEITVLHASGVGLLRIGRSVFIFAIVCTVATGYILQQLVPRANQRQRQLMYDVAKMQFQQGIQAKEFYEGFAGYVIYVTNIDDDTSVWRDIMVCDSSVPEEIRLIFARQGRMKYNEAEKYVILELQEGESYTVVRNDTEKTSLSTFTTQRLLFSMDRFSDKPLPPGQREMSLQQLSDEIKKRLLMGARWQPFAVEYHKKVAIPVACMVFGIFGLALGARNRSRGQSAGFVVSVAIILVYYILLTSGERLGDQGDLSPWFGMWMANLLIGGIGLWLLFLAAREIELGVWDFIITTATRVPSLATRLWAPRRQRKPQERKRVRSRGKTIVIRIPRIGPNFPRILDRYVLREWGRTFVMILLGITAIYILIDFSKIINDITENNIPMQTVVDYYKFSLPQIFFLMLGPTALVTTLFVFGVMNRNNEIIAMKASGLSIYRIIVPSILVALLLSVGSFFVNDRIIPIATRKAIEKRDEILKGPKRSHEYRGTRWIWGEGNRRLYNYVGYDSKSAVMDDVRVFELDPKVFTLRRIVAGHKATYDEARGWVFEDAWVRRFERQDSSPYRSQDVLSVGYPERPDYFVTENKAVDELNIEELKDYIKSMEAAGFPARSLKVSLEWKYSLPFVPLVMALIGVPFALRIGKRGNLFGVGVSVALVTIFWAFVAAFRPLGEAGLFPALLSAWAPNLLFGITGVYMLLTLET